jgi:hypothetical protein
LLSAEEAEETLRLLKELEESIQDGENLSEGE